MSDINHYIHSALWHVTDHIVIPVKEVQTGTGNHIQSTFLDFFHYRRYERTDSSHLLFQNNNQDYHSQ